jgi:hypothetical protein
MFHAAGGKRRPGRRNEFLAEGTENAEKGKTV